MKRELRAMVCLVICLLMQAVAVFPHHHHNHLVCLHDDFISEECESEDAGHHQGDDCCEQGCCAGCTTHIVTFDEVVEDDDCFPDYSFYSLIYCLFECVNTNHSGDGVVNVIVSYCLHDGFPGDGMGLRAPPFLS